jgi:hypothetical protein
MRIIIINTKTNNIITYYIYIIYDGEVINKIFKILYVFENSKYSGDEYFYGYIC